MTTETRKRTDAMRIYLVKGDYVAATRYRDGDPKDGWAIGYFDKQDDRGRFYVVDDEWKQFHRDGFSRAQRIRDSVGQYLIATIGESTIDSCGRSFWGLVKKAQSKTKGQS